MAGTRTRRAGLRRLVGLWVGLFDRHNLLTYASAIAFQSLVAFVALVLLTLGVLEAIGRPDVWTNELAPQIAPKVLAPVFSGLDATVQKVFQSSSTGLIAFAAVLTVWEISGVVRACMGALAVIYEDEETRPWWIRFPVSIGLSILVTAALVGSILLSTAARTAVHGTWGVPFAVARWLLTVVLLTLAFGALMRLAPSKPRTTRWASGGATLVVVAWIVQGLLFAEYLRTFADYRTAAGSLLGVYFLTTFLYVGAIVLLVGIELDEQLRRDVSGEAERGILRLVRDVL